MDLAQEYRWDCRYAGLAASLGLVWYLLLFTLSGGWPYPKWTAQELMMPITFALSSLMVAMLFRPIIRRARGLRLLILGTALVYVGAFVCSCLLSTVIVATDDPRDLLLLPTLVFSYTSFAVHFVTSQFFITIPLAFGSVAVLRRIGRDGAGMPA